jgi:lipopolysaccharide export system protein LptA
MAQRDTGFRRQWPALVLPLTLLLCAAIPASSADGKRPSTPFEGFSSESDKPVNIKADALEMHNDEQKAIFTGNVEATQGDSVMTSEELTVFYESAKSDDADKAAPAGGDQAPAPAQTSTPGQTAAPAQASAGGTQPEATAQPQASDAAASDDPANAGNKVKLLLAKGNVVVTSKDQKATGDDGILDMQTNIATLTGQEVVMTQGCNVMKGRKLVVNTQTGLANVSGGTTGHFTSGSDPSKC